MIGLMAKSLDELPETLRGFCKLEGDRVELDETAIRTKADVDTMAEAKRKEVNDHNATKAVLAAWKKLGESPESIAEKLADLENRSGNSSELTEKLAALQRENRKIVGERDALKTEMDGIKPQFEAQRKQIHESKTAEVLEKAVGKLKGVDAARLTRSLKRDIALGLIDLDESGEGLAVKTGETFENYAIGQANDYGFKLASTPGASNPGTERIPEHIPQVHNGSGAEEGYLDDDIAAKLDS